MFRLGCIDIKGTYLQNVPIERCIYVTTQIELGLPRYILWRLRKRPCGITEARHQWAKEIESWLVYSACFTRLLGMSQVYIKRDENNRVMLMAVKVTEDILLAGNIDRLKRLAEEIYARYKVRKIIFNNAINFNRCKITQDNIGDICMNMTELLV